MDGKIQIAIFETEWGICGLLCRGSRIVRFSLPDRAERIEKILTQGIQDIIICNSRAGIELQSAVRNYFQGKPIDFDRFDVDLSALTHFQQKVLIACRAVRFGQTATYSELARQAGSPRAVRAAASALAANPIPLVIPCHRILRKDGGFGGFSATGGIRFKAQLLRLERKDA